jgi:hypothetical protein
MDKFGPADNTALCHHLIAFVRIHACKEYEFFDDVSLTLPGINYLMSYVRRAC